MTRHPPKLPREFCGRCLPIGTGDSRNMIWKWLEKRRGKMCKGLARIGFGNVHCAAHHGFGPRDNRHSASGDSIVDKIFAVKCRAFKSTKNRAGRNLPMVDRKAGHCNVCKCHIGTAYQSPELHYCSPFAFHTKGINSETSTSRVISGRIPTNGPMRVTVFCTTGAAVKPAVR